MVMGRGLETEASQAEHVCSTVQLWTNRSLAGQPELDIQGQTAQE